MTDRETDVLDQLLLEAPPLPTDYAPAILRHARHRRRVRRLTVVAGAGGLALVVAAGVFVVSQRTPSQSIRLVQSPSPTASPPTAAAAPASEEIAIQAAAIQELADRVGDHRDWPVLFILTERYDGITGAPGARREAGPVTPAEQDALATALADYASVEFLSNRADAYTVGTLAVRDGGALVTLGQIPRLSTDRATFTLSVQVNGLNGQGVTFEFSRTGDRWAVTGTIGPGWIS